MAEFAPNSATFGLLAVVVVRGETADRSAFWQSSSSTLPSWKFPITGLPTRSSVCWIHCLRIHMAPNDDIIAACRRRKVRLMWGQDDAFVDMLAALPEAAEIQTQLSAQFIADEIAILQEEDPPFGGKGKSKPAPDSPSAPDAMDLTGRGVLMQRLRQIAQRQHETQNTVQAMALEHEARELVDSTIAQAEPLRYYEFFSKTE